MIRFLLLLGILVLNSCTTLSSSKLDSRTLVLTSPTVFSSGTQSNWESMAREITRSSAKTIIFYWQGYGGDMDIGMTIISAIERAKSQGKTVIIKVIGYSASMHALVPCYASKVEQENGGVLMFHLASTIFGVDHSRYSQNQVRELMQGCVAKGIVTEGDIREVQSGRELYVLPNGQKRTAPDKREH